MKCSRCKEVEATHHFSVGFANGETAEVELCAGCQCRAWVVLGALEGWDDVTLDDLYVLTQSPLFDLREKSLK
jgi:formate dehydrogenase maturation protein FdhE